MHLPKQMMLDNIAKHIRKLPTDWLGTIADLTEKLTSDAGPVWLVEIRKFLRKEPCWVSPVGRDSTPILHDDLTHLTSFQVEVPKDFTLDGCSRTGFSYWNQNTTDSNFPKGGLVQVKKYTAEVYRLNCDISSKLLVDIGLANKRILGGAKGGAVLCSRYGDKLPKDRWVIAIDEKKNLWHDSDGASVPNFGRSGGGWNFDLGSWTSDWPGGHIVVFFRELN
jgi:hypothetical protein